MTLDELNATLAAALASEKAGTPVSLRLHLQVAETTNDSVDLTAMLMPLVETVFNARASRLLARRNVAADQLNVLFTLADGKTAFITCGRGSTRHTSLQLLLVGNHGIIRLEGGQLFKPGKAVDAAGSRYWRTAIEKSLAANAPISLARLSC